MRLPLLLRGVGAPHQCSRVNEKRSGWGVGFCHWPAVDLPCMVPRFRLAALSENAAADPPVAEPIPLHRHHHRLALVDKVLVPSVAASLRVGAAFAVYFACHCYKPSECETARQHKVAELACYRLERRLVVVPNPPRQCPQVNTNMSGWIGGGLGVASLARTDWLCVVKLGQHRVLPAAPAPSPALCFFKNHKQWVLDHLVRRPARHVDHVRSVAYNIPFKKEKSK